MMVKVSTPARDAIVTFASFMKMRFLPVFLSIIVLTNAGQANDVLPAAKEEHPILLHGGTLHPISAEPIPQGKLLIRGDRIVAIGQADERLSGKEDAHRVSCRGRHVYPGLISANGTLGLIMPGSRKSTVALTAEISTNPSVPFAEINPG